MLVTWVQMSAGLQRASTFELPARAQVRTDSDFQRRGEFCVLMFSGRPVRSVVVGSMRQRALAILCLALTATLGLAAFSARIAAAWRS
jgi:hypothetical protein